MERIPPKLLFVFNLEGTLCKHFKAAPASITHLDPSPKVVMRPDLDAFLRWMFVKNKLFFKAGIWTDISSEETEKLVQPVFGRFAGSLLFKYASPNDPELKDLKRIWYNYPAYGESNTLYIDYKDSVVQKKNQLIIGDFSEDNALPLIQDYLKFFSYQFHHKKIHSLTDFMIKTPFKTFMFDWNRPENTDDPRTRKFG